MKNKGKQPQVAKPELLALCYFCPCSSDGPERLGANEEAPGENPGPGTTSNSPTHRANWDGILPSVCAKGWVATPTVILAALLEESKAEMTCHNCGIVMVKTGFYGKNKVERFKYQQCGKRFSEPRE